MRAIFHRRLRIATAASGLLAAALLCGTLGPPAAAQGAGWFDQNSDSVSRCVKGLLDDGRWQPGHVRLDWRALRAFYARRNFAPAWTNSGDAGLVHAALAHAEGEGLNAADYDPNEIVATSDSDPGRHARFDLLLTNSLLRYMHDVRQGRLSPDSVYKDAELKTRSYDDAADLAAATSSGSLDEFLKSLPPPQDGYRALRALLGRYRDIAAHGGWAQLPQRRTNGGNDSYIQALGARLAAEDPSANGSNGRDVTQALMRFQTAHGLDATGTLDSDTVAELNVDVRTRILQIEANMERWRWLPRQFEDRYVEVNVPAAALQVVDKDQIMLRSKVIVGRETDPTPLLKAAATSLTLNPVWHIPTKIAKKEILPKAMKDPDYLQEHHIESVDGSLTKLKQLPGPKNALGAIRIDMPNRFNVYLHDTPGQAAFAKNERDESHGCMRVEQIVPLASIALTGDPQAAVQKLDDEIEAGDTEKVPFTTPLMVYVDYWTVTAANDGSARFWPDIYGRDERLISALRNRSAAQRLSAL
ncbi:MAG: L,D-transpeptidase family protein [Alphaproteobacteria bacterium]|nr:L,D-transpeptidase family protein [Alphaproteobacteria bacterium]